MEESSSLPWVIVNLVFACLALGLGFVSGAFYYGGKRATQDSEGENDAEEMLQRRIAMERALLASGQLHDIASGVAIEVSDHSRQVEEISLGLREAESAGGAVTQQHLGRAMSQLLDANDKLQERLEEAEKQIRAQALEIANHENEARTDSLTDLSNRRAFDDELGRRFSEWQRKSTPFCLAILDVDHFKAFNDTHGHQVGDEVLKAVAAALKSSTRGMDIPCRYGGEEFAVILPSTILGDAGALAERIRTAITNQSIEHDGQSLSVTASFGVAEVQDADDAKLILRRADEALYEAKGAGRNCGYYNAEGKNHPIIAPKAEPKSAKGVDLKKTPLKLLDSLPNRTTFVNQLSLRIAESSRTQQPLAIFSVGIEGYQRIKSDYSEAAALFTLDSVAQFLQKSLREMDVVARTAEDHFAVLLPGAKADEARRVSERASAALKSCAVPIGDDHVHLDARFAFAAATANDTAAGLLERAESALGAAPDAEPVLVS